MTMCAIEAIAPPTLPRAAPVMPATTVPTPAPAKAPNTAATMNNMPGS
jgi:hypothetical protein